MSASSLIEEFPYQLREWAISDYFWIDHTYGMSASSIEVEVRRIAAEFLDEPFSSIDVSTLSWRLFSYLMDNQPFGPPMEVSPTNVGGPKELRRE